jgi:hypothetical protein
MLDPVGPLVLDYATFHIAAQNEILALCPQI